MGKYSLKKMALIACALLLIFIVGCESVGGRNINQLILKQLEVEKLEQSQFIEVDIDYNENQLNEEDAKTAQMMKWFEKTSLEITHSKIDGKGSMWVKGVFTFSKGSIPFTLHADSKTVRLDVEGVSRPLILDIHSVMRSPLPGLMPPVHNAGAQDALVKSARQLIRNVAPYFVNALPNPPVISVEPATENVNGVSTSLTKVHAELNGEQLGELIPIYLDRLIQDKEGFRSMLRTVVQWAMDLPPEMKEIFDTGFEEEKNIEAYVDEGMAELWPMLEDAQKELKDMRQDDEWKEIFDKGITLTTDLYFDDQMYLRKSAMQLKIAPAAFAREDFPVRQITVRTRGEMWNVNGDVAVPAVDVPANALNFEEMGSMQPFKILGMMDKQSVIYNILKNDLQVDDQSFTLSSEWGVPFYQDKKGVAYVPIRSTMDEFGVALSTSARKGEIRFYDEATGQKFLFLIGSQKAFVDGKAVKLSYKVTVDKHFTYIAAPDLFRLLKAEYKVTKSADGGLRMTVTRDL
ncbi:hypothetical protein SD71_09155 [Cohnella kolymensis]|uniref:Copper amine oxidase-like N-terminal domain-containing protein n=1 Tax=Cohnella kolymensis TaxID=1590652 RepID=A0ABR5A526_9BACL|nr:stalk domain-containing protein [Cohnella kolymensis]KIL36133.1 hypothetical protein SD71_09155 [Cohnella kolymensis]